MRSLSLTVLVAVLAALAGCLGAPGAGPAAADGAGVTDTTATTATPTTGTPAADRSTSAGTPGVNMTNETAGERAIAAEKARIRQETSEWENLSSLDFGMLVQPNYTVLDRNESGVLVDVTVGYSMMLDCGLSVDGAWTETRYFVTPDEARLVAVDQDVDDDYDNACEES